jgi:hypothetical protein
MFLTSTTARNPIYQSTDFHNLQAQTQGEIHTFLNRRTEKFRYRKLNMSFGSESRVQKKYKLHYQKITHWKYNPLNIIVFSQM